MDIKDMTMQDIQLEIIRRNSFNGFDGVKIANSLTRNKHLWKSVLMDSVSWSFAYEKGDKECIQLIKLRDLDQNFFNVDTLFILPKEGKAEELESFAKRNWRPDETKIVSGDKAGSWLGMGGFPDLKIVKLWWD